MTSLVDFLTARLAEDEQIARAAAARASDWHSSKGNVGGGGEFSNLGDPDEEPYWHGDEVIVYDEGWPLAVEANHIARHDPARVLREVEVKRAMVRSLIREGCNGCGIDELWDDEEYTPTGRRYLKLFARVYSDHPDYQEKWTL